MALYYVRGVTAATAGTADHAIAALWNPDSVKRIRVTEFSIFKTAAGTAGDSARLVRITARGTAGSSVTPDADNSEWGDDAPQSAAVLDLAAYSAQPTLASPGMYGWVAAAIAAAGVTIPCSIYVPPGTGLAFVQRVATAWPISEVNFVFEE